LTNQDFPREVSGAPTREEWINAVALRGERGALPTIDVIIPVYDGLVETLRCIFSVLTARQTTAYRLLIINDCSPNPELVRWLEWLSLTGVGDLVTNPVNLGFPATCNRAMGLSERDVILLNSDTEVYHDWLDRFVEVAASSPRVGTITAMSNNATIASYPVWLEGSNDELEVSWSRVDEIASVVNRGLSVSVPTGIGFCMYISRAGLDKVGDFDQVAFKAGYGEENDLCRRLEHAGFSNLIAGNIFVLHVGSVSFGKRRQQLSKEGMKALLIKHPDYNQLVHEFIARDPMAQLRRNIDLARIAQRSDKPPMMFITHTWGGGIETHTHDMASRLMSEGYTVLFCRPNGKDRRKLDVTSSQLAQLSALGPMDFTDPDGPFWDFVSKLAPGAHAHVHSLAGWEHDSPALLARGLSRHGVQYDMTFHDYSPICPQVHLVDSTDRYCALPPVDICQLCCESTFHPDFIPDVRQWREDYELLLRGARQLFAPSLDTAHRYERQLPGLTINHRPHSPLVIRQTGSKRHLRIPPKTDRRRIILLGRISPVKGIQVVVATAKFAAERGLPLEFVILGDSSLGWFKGSPNIFVTGEYEQSEVDDLIKQIDGDLFWFPAIAPETFSYALSTAMATNLNIVSFDIGAIAERLQAAKRGVIHPIELMLEPERLAVELLEVPLGVNPDAMPEVPAHYPELASDYYQL
jgi:GT2 family glycosyltransferase/glycosyltransferase involved in cell wall biosynthesis